MAKYLTHSEEETRKLAQDLARKIKKGVIALTGDLGAGKTIFVQGFAKGFGIKDKIISPTFVLIRQHQIRSTNKLLYHIDLYRLENIKEMGLEEIIKSDNIILIEWAEKIKEILGKNTLWIKIEKKDENKRLIILS